MSGKDQKQKITLLKWVFLIVMSLLIVDVARMASQSRDQAAVLCTLGGEPWQPTAPR